MNEIINGTIKYFANSKLISSPKSVSIDNINSYYCSLSYSMPLKNGTVMYVRDRIYGIPTKRYFYIVNMIDGVNLEDCSKLYNKIIKSIKIKR